MRWLFGRRKKKPRDVLRELPLFAELDDDALGALIGEVYRFRSNERLFSAGDVGEELFLVAEGVIELSRGGQKLAICERLAFVGLPAALGRAHSVDATGIEGGRLIALPLASLTRFSQTDPTRANRLLLALSRDLAQRLRAVDEQLIGQLHAWSTYR